MHVYITNLINNKENATVSKFASDLGFKEIPLVDDKGLGIALADEQVKNINSNDLVIVQLPLTYDRELFELLKEKNIKIACFMHRFENINSQLYNASDCFIVDATYKDKTKNNPIEIQTFSEFYIKKALIECAESFVEESTSKDLIHIAFGLHDKSGNYSVWVGATMQSVIDHTNGTVCFHILHDDTLNEENRAKLIRVAESGNCFVEFHPINIRVFDHIASQVKGYTIGSVFRILIPDLLMELDKVLYLDADLFVNVDIEDLWNTDIDDYCIGAVQDMNVVNHSVKPLPVAASELNYDEYFNSGVLLLNLNKIRENGDMKQQITDYLISHTESNLPDQDALNVVYRGKVKFLDPKYNYFVRNMRSNHEVKLQNRIYHYVGTICVLYHLNEVDYSYLQTMMKINWGNKNINDTIGYSFGRINDRINQYEKMIYNHSNNNDIRLLCGEPYIINNFYSLFGKKQTDIVVNDLHSLESVINELLNKNMNFYCILSAGISGVIELVESHGLKGEKDFYVMQRFLSNLNGGYL